VKPPAAAKAPPAEEQPATDPPATEPPPLLRELPPPLRPALPSPARPAPSARVEARVESRRSAALEPRPPTGIERAVRRTLEEPHRREPINELAQRLLQDSQQTGSRTLLVVGIGEGSLTHDTLLHVAALIAEQADVALVDADPARRLLSEQLDAIQRPGLGDLLQGDRQPAELLLPTAFRGLSFLPVGTQPFADLRSAADMLTTQLARLAGGFRLVLVDGGRTGDSAVTTLARACDAAYFVVRLGSVETAQAQQALRDFRAAGARVLGSIALS
jgi:Mrp family chromosome partitioning ATPase